MNHRHTTGPACTSAQSACRVTDIGEERAKPISGHVSILDGEEWKHENSLEGNERLENFCRPGLTIPIPRQNATDHRHTVLIDLTLELRFPTCGEFLPRGE